MKRLLTLTILALALIAPSSASAAPIRECGDIIYTPQSDDTVSNIATRDLTCRAARRALRRYKYLNGGGWRCVKVPGTGGGFEGSGRRHCRKHGKLIAYSYP